MTSPDLTPLFIERRGWRYLGPNQEGKFATWLLSQWQHSPQLLPDTAARVPGGLRVEAVFPAG